MTTSDAAELFKRAVTALEAACDALTATMGHVEAVIRDRGMGVGEVAVDFGVSRAFAEAMVEGRSVGPEGIGNDREAGLRRFVETVYRDVDSYRQGLLCCTVTDARTVMISCTHPSGTYRERYDDLARTLGMDIDWPHANMSLTELAKRLPVLDADASADGAPQPAGTIGRFGVTLETASDRIRSRSYEPDWSWLEAVDPPSG